MNEAFPVPANQELCFLFESEGEVRSICVDAAVDGQTIDLRPAATIVRAVPGDQEIATNRFQVPPGSSIHITSPNPGCDLKGVSEQILATVQGPMGAQFLVEVRAPGCASVWHRGHIPYEGEFSPTKSLEPVPFASPKIVADQAIQVMGMEPEDLRALVPGPLHLVVTRGDAPPLGLQLNLRPGAGRLIDLRDRAK